MFEPEELCQVLRQFYAEVRQKNGNKYSRSGLTNIRASLQRHLTSPPFNRNINIIRDREFQAANAVIQGQIKILRQSGNDITKHKKPIDSEDMAKIRESFKVETPAGLQNKVFFDLLLHFARRGQEGLRELTKTSLVIKKDSRGRKYATMAYNEREKNHQGQNLKERDTEKLMFERPGDASCPVVSLEKYISKLNPRCDAFFQRPKTNFIADSNCWYDNMAVGKNTLGNKMKVISAEAKCSSVYTNHCVRATAVTALARGGTEHQDICSVTGHKRVDSLHPYLAVPTKAERCKMSKILHQFGTSSTSATSNSSNSPPNSPVPSTSRASSSPVASTSTEEVSVAVPPPPNSDTGAEEPAPKVARRDAVAPRNIQNDMTITNSQDFRSLFSGNNFYGTVNFYIKNWSPARWQLNKQWHICNYFVSYLYLSMLFEETVILKIICWRWNNDGTGKWEVAFEGVMKYRRSGSWMLH